MPLETGGTGRVEAGVACFLGGSWVVIRPKGYQVWVIQHVLMQESYELPLDAFGFSSIPRLPQVEAVKW